MKIRLSLILAVMSLLTGFVTAGCGSEKKDTPADIKEFKGSTPPPEVQKMIEEKMRQGGQAAPAGGAPASAPK